MLYLLGRGDIIFIPRLAYTCDIRKNAFLGRDKDEETLQEKTHFFAIFHICSKKVYVCLPISIRESAGIEKGDKLLMIKNGRTILLEKLKTSDFRDLLKHSEKVAEKLWNSKDNDVWDIVFEQRDIIIVPFPFSDLSGSKQRPVLILSTLEYNKHTEDLIT